MKYQPNNGEAVPADTSIEAALFEQTNAASEPLRSYIRELERQADPASNIRELVYAREEKKMLGIAIFELKQAIRKHQDSQPSDQRRTNDQELYQVLDEPG